MEIYSGSTNLESNLPFCPFLLFFYSFFTLFCHESRLLVLAFYSFDAKMPTKQALNEVASTEAGFTTTCRPAYQITREIIAVITACFDDSLVQVLRRSKPKRVSATQRARISSSTAHKNHHASIVPVLLKRTRSEAYLLYCLHT